MIIDNNLFVYNNSPTHRDTEKDSMNQDIKQELSSNESTNNDWKTLCSRNISNASASIMHYENVNEHEIGTFIYLLAMLIISNILTSVLRVFYRYKVMLIQ
jgi:hypothetical protein